MNAANPGNPQFKKTTGDAARALGIRLEIIELKEPSELRDAFARLRLLRVDGVAIIPDAILSSESVATMIAELARENKLPSIGDLSFADAGGLFGFSEDYSATARLSARFVDQILKGTPPGELPAEQSRDYKVCCQPKDSEGIEHHHPANAARPCR
jgi:putative ABC transport system substrate-binding protein